MEFFFSFRVSVFKILFSLELKIQLRFEMFSTGTYRSVIPTLREKQKAQLAMNFFTVASKVFPQM